MALAAPPDVTVEAGSGVKLTATSTEPTCTWQQVSGPPVDLTQDGLTASFYAPLRPGQLVLRATSGPDSDDVTVTATRAACLPSGARLWPRSGGQLSRPGAPPRPRAPRATTEYAGEGAPATANAANASTSAAVPLASMTVGDYNLVAITVMPTANSTDPGEPTVPAGWAVVASVFDTGSPGVRLTVLGKAHAEGDPSTVTITWAAAASYAARTVAYQGVASAAGVATAQAATSATFPTGTLTTSEPGWLATAAGCRTAGTWTMPDTPRTTAAVSSSVSVAISDTNADQPPGAHSRDAMFTAGTSVGAAALLHLIPAAYRVAHESSGPSGIAPPAGFATLVLNSTFDTGLPTEWRREPDGSNYGITNNSVGIWSHSNITTGPALLPGAGHTLRLTSSYDGTTYRCGMVQTRTGSSAPFDGTLFPRYAWYEFRARVPDGKALWPGLWLRHKHGSSVCEVDISETCNGETPGHSRWTLHRRPGEGQATTLGLGKNNIYLQHPYEPDGTTRKPPGWHTIACAIYPAGGGDPAQPSSSVVFDTYIDGVLRHSYTDTAAAYWTGLAVDDAFDICMQGAQIGGTWIGHPEDPIGYSRYINSGAGGCLLSGTPPACSTVFQGVPIVATLWDDPVMSTLEVDYVRVWKYTG